jgi:hypothetical protein
MPARDSENAANRLCTTARAHVSDWPTSSNVAAQANVGVQGNCGRAGRSPKPTFLTRLRH